MIPLFLVDEVCLVCRKVCLDRFGEHAIHCREFQGFKYTNDFVRDVLFDVFKHMYVNFMTNPLEGRSILRLADVLVYGWVGGKHAYMCGLDWIFPTIGIDDR
jgi:hypothetical protein